ncbi:ABC transporter ATP-binding protein [Leptospira sp. GIMC2001]|uniref:ABC transporter ATP-binding protein n=1 Tax=Leptospira sp. GIMC2001 TaxID=1513297 RepID=UPI0023493F99|nr:ABC transporter ATP-binding protein [Leptospira sp. GIMC2001]WCL50905.1 ABC transporter ATP-binding protein [Leptospira sp. GIMC2001]
MKSPILEVESLCKQYHSTIALNNISFSLEKGEILSLIGPNGAGKTSLIKIIAGISKPNSGSVRTSANDQAKSIWQIIGYCPQQNVFWPNLNCLEQVMIMAKMYSVQVTDIEAHCKSILSDLGLGNKLMSKAITLSHGMQKRLSIALSIVHSPSILILDEPSAGLDPYSRRFLRDFLNKLHTEKMVTIIVSTHELTEADVFSTKVAIMNQGKLLKFGKANELKASLGGRFVLEIPNLPELNHLSDAFSKYKNQSSSSYNDKHVFYYEDLDSLIHSDIFKLENISNGEIPYTVRPVSLEDVFYSFVKEDQADY